MDPQRIVSLTIAVTFLTVFVIAGWSLARTVRESLRENRRDQERWAKRFEQAARRKVNDK